ncbi:MAG: xanthine dehydrogenase family protein molybdopterin-binding subunit, partial [Chloroflexota bacterium]
MATYIGAPIPRVDGFAKVTGAAKYAAEFEVPDLVHGSVVTSTIARGRILRIDDSAARRLAGVLEVFTHENRPPMAADDRDWSDDTAPAGSPFRPLYDDRVRFNRQPIALVVAETSEIARFAASLVQVQYEVEEHETDVSRARATARPATDPVEEMFAPPK